jgi:TonB-dependent starch-binding outer membrane protein SusC
MRKVVLLLIAMVLSVSYIWAQRTITGKVRDDKGSAIPGASVIVKGTNLGTSTGSDGSFSISVPSNAKALIVSSVGLGEREITLTANNDYAVSLSTRAGDMTEVVVVAYGTKKKTELTGSVATVKGADIENKPFTSVDKALQGAVAGLQSVAASGAPGANQQIRIRGISSITASNAPLWVIDGVPVLANDLSRQTTSANILSTLNPNDIESISVLKDAASASIYGNRAANGVILVTTKKGRAGKTKFRFDTEIGQSDIAYVNDDYRPLNAAEYLAITREGLVNFGASQATIDATLASRGGSNNVDYDWLKGVTQKGAQQQYNLSALGGNDKTTFYMSGGYFYQQGTVIKSSLSRYSGNIRVTNKASDKLTINANINGGFVRQKTPLAGGAFGNPVLSSRFVLPTKPAYKPDGSLNFLSPDFRTSDLYNTIAVAELDKRYLKELSLRGNVSAEYEIIKNLKVKSSFGADLSVLEEDQYNNPLYGDGAVYGTGSPLFNPGVTYNLSTTGRVIEAYTRWFNWNWANTISYKGDILKSGDLSYSVQGGVEANENRQYFSSLQGRGFSISPLLYLQYPSSTATPTTASGAISEATFLSFFGLGDINYQDRFILSGSFRRDGSSRFGSNNRWGNFWSVGGSWNIDKENFMKSLSFFDQLKIRASYGVTGNGGIGNYDWFPSYAFSSSYNSIPGSVPGNVGNLDLSWEINKPLNIGLDVSVFKSRLNVSVDWYRRKSEELLLNVPLSPTSGFASQTQNIGEMENKGIELSIIATPVRSKDFTWTVNFNFARNKNKVLTLPGGNPIIGTFIIKEGLDVQSFYTRVYAGVDQANGDPLWYLDSTKTTTTNVYSSAQRVAYGSASPKFFGGFTNTLSYKGFTVEAQFNYQFGNLVQDSWASYYLGAGFNAGFNKIYRVLDRWQKPGDQTDIPKYIEGGNKSFQSFSSFYLAEGDFIRLRNLQIGYDLPKSFLSRIKVENASFYVRGTNLWTWVKDKKLGWDPEEGIASQTNLDVLIPKSITFGLNLGF